MRFIAVRIAVRIAWLGVAARPPAVSACVPIERNTVELARVQVGTAGSEPVAIPEIIRAAPEEIGERAVVGGILGGDARRRRRRHRVGQPGLRRGDRRDRPGPLSAPWSASRPRRRCPATRRSRSRPARHSRVLRHLAAGISLAAGRSSSAAAAPEWTPAFEEKPVPGEDSRPPMVGPGRGPAARAAVTGARQQLRPPAAGRRLACDLLAAACLPVGRRL